MLVGRTFSTIAAPCGRARVPGGGLVSGGSSGMSRRVRCWR